MGLSIAYPSNAAKYAILANENDSSKSWMLPCTGIVWI